MRVASHPPNHPVASGTIACHLCQGPWCGQIVVKIKSNARLDETTRQANPGLQGCSPERIRTAATALRGRGTDRSGLSAGYLPDVCAASDVGGAYRELWFIPPAIPRSASERLPVPRPRAGTTGAGWHGGLRMRLGLVDGGHTPAQ